MGKLARLMALFQEVLVLLFAAPVWRQFLAKIRVSKVVLAVPPVIRKI